MTSVVTLYRDSAVAEINLGTKTERVIASRDDCNISYTNSDVTDTITLRLYCHGKTLLEITVPSTNGNTATSNTVNYLTTAYTTLNGCYNAIRDWKTAVNNPSAYGTVAPGSYGDITVDSTGNTWTVNAGVIGTNSLGEDITTAGKALLTGVNAAAQRTTLGLGNWSTLNYPVWANGTPFVKMTAAGTFALDTKVYAELNNHTHVVDDIDGFESRTKLVIDNSLTAGTNVSFTGNAQGGGITIGFTGVSSISATSPITSSGGTTPTISTSMSTGKLIGRYSAGSGVMQEITIGTGLSLSGTGTLTSTISGLPIGGTAGQVLTKVNATDYNATWQDVAASYTSVVKHTVKNNGAAVIDKGTPVYSTGSDGTNILVAKASNASEATSSKTMGLTQTQLTTSGSGQTGFVVTEGLLDGLNTAGTTAGDPVWLGVDGALIYGLTNKPYAPAHLVFIGIVTKVSNGNGEIFVKVQNGFELDELHNVDLKTTTPINGHILGYDSTLWVNKTIAGWLGYTPENIANKSDSYTVSSSTTYSTTKALVDGLATKENTLGFTPENVANKQTDLTASSTKYPTVNAVNTGLSTKEPTITAGTTAQYWRGDKSWQTLDKSAVGLSNVDNTSDANKPVSTATQSALNLKENTITAGTTSQYYRGDKTFQTLDKAAVGLSNVDNTSDANKPVSNATQTALNNKLNTSLKGAINGLAELDGTGKVPAAQLPSYVDDVLEVANFAALPGTGETGKIYVTIDTGLTYRWTGTIYTEISSSKITNLSLDDITASGTINILNDNGSGVSIPLANSLGSGIISASNYDKLTALSTSRQIPPLGSTGQVLGKISGTDYAVGWIDNVVDGSVTFAKMANISNNTLIGRFTAGTGSPESIGIGSGLSNTGTTLYNTLAVGLGSNQTIIGGLNASGTLTLSSTSNATKGKILFGNSAYDEANQRLGIGTQSPTSAVHFALPTNLSGTQNAMYLSSAFDATATGTKSFIQYDLTTAGSSGNTWGLALNLLPGQTGTASTQAIRIINTTTTSPTFDPFIGSGNSGATVSSSGAGGGANYGMSTTALNALFNIGNRARAAGGTTANSTNVGVLGIGNVGTSTGTVYQIGGYFTLETVTPTLTFSAALACNNGTATNDIFVARDNGTAVFTIADGGAVNSTGNITVPDSAYGASWNGDNTVPTKNAIYDKIETLGGGGGSYTFSTGLTNTAGTVTSNLSTGIAGGQSVIGGTAASENLTLSSTSNATKGKIILGSASAYDEVNDRLGIGTTSPIVALHVVRDAIAGSFFRMDALNGAPGLQTYRLNGTIASPTNTVSGNIIGLWSMRGHDGTNYVNAARATFVGLASENWTSTAQGTYIRFETTATGTTTLSERLRIDHDGAILIGTTTNSGFKLDVNGTARASTSLDTPILRGSASASGTLTLSSTSNATKGKIVLGSLSAYDEANDRLGIGTTSPTNTFHISKNITASSGNALIGLVNGTLTASANNDTLNGLNVNLTFSNGAFTGVNNYLQSWSNGGTLRSFVRWDGLQQWDMVNASNVNVGRIQYGYPSNNVGMAIFDWDTTNSVYFNRYNIANEGTFFYQGFHNINNLGGMALFNTTHNLVIGYTGTPTDSGFKLDVTGTARASTSLDTPIIRGGTTSGGTLTISSTNNATKGNIIFGTSAYDEVNNRLGIGTTSPLANLHIVGESSAELFFDRYITSVASVPAFLMRKARGSITSPLAIQSGDRIGVVGFRGYGSTAFSSGSRAFYGANASENWTDTANGTELVLFTTTNTTTTASERLRVCNNGNILIGTTTDSGFKLDVNGTIRAQGDVTVPDAAYGAGWNGNNTVPTKNAVYDKIESLVISGGGVSESLAIAYAVAL